MGGGECPVGDDDAGGLVSYITITTIIIRVWSDSFPFVVLLLSGAELSYYNMIIYCRFLLNKKPTENTLVCSWGAHSGDVWECE